MVAVSDIVRQKWDEEMRQAIARQQREEEEAARAAAAAAAEAERQRELEAEKQKQLLSAAAENDKLSPDKDKESVPSSADKSDSVDSASPVSEKITNSASSEDSHDQSTKDLSSSSAVGSSLSTSNTNNSHVVVSTQSLSPPGDAKTPQQPAVESAPIMPAQQANFVAMTALLPVTQHAFHNSNLNPTSLASNVPTSAGVTSAPPLHWMQQPSPAQMWGSQQRAAMGPMSAQFNNTVAPVTGLVGNVPQRDPAAWGRDTQKAMFDSILKPQPAPSSKTTTSPKDAQPATQALDLSDFDKQQDPFERLELETLDDREVLKQVLSQTASGAGLTTTNSRSDVSFAVNNNTVSLAQQQQQAFVGQGHSTMLYHPMNNANFYRPAMHQGPSQTFATFNGETAYNRQSHSNPAATASHLPGGFFPGSYPAQPHIYGNYYPPAQQHFQRASTTNVSQANAATSAANSAYVVARQFAPVSQRNAVNNTNPWKQELYSSSLPKSDVSGFAALTSDGYGHLGGRFSATGRQTEAPPRQTLRSAKSWTDIRDAFRDEEEASLSSRGSSTRRSVGKSSKTPPPYTDAERRDYYAGFNRPVVDGHTASVGVNGGRSLHPHLSADARHLVDRMTGMGFDRQVVATAVERLGVASEQQVML